jgi:hypothetical protein
VNRAAVTCALLIWASPLWAGHGMLNAFGGIAWLPPAGTTPDSPWYPADRWRERAALALAEVPARPTLAEAIAREKLAEAEAMLKAGKTAPAATALSAWQEAAHALIATTEAFPAARRQVVNALLEQQYIAMTDYLDLPRTFRPPLLATTRSVEEACARLLAQLSRGEREALFFRTEEVRWSLEMAAAADAQGL